MDKKIYYSFIIPYHNSPQWLDRCVSSIPEREDVEIIIVDDNSDENEKAKIENRKNTIIIYLDANHSKGAGHARNVGLEMAKGKWLLFPDSDDSYIFGFLDRLDDYKDSDIDILYFNFEYLDGISNTILPDLHFQKYFREYDGSELSCNQVKFHHNVPWTKMVNRKLIDQYNIRFEETPNGNDILFSMMVGYHAKDIIVEKTELYRYYKNPNSIINNKIQTIESCFCRIEHRFKQNSFYRFIGYPEWGTNIITAIASELKVMYNSGIRHFLLFSAKLFYYLPIFYSRRNEWVNTIKDL